MIGDHISPGRDYVLEQLPFVLRRWWLREWTTTDDDRKLQWDAGQTWTSPGLSSDPYCDLCDLDLPEW